MEHLRGFGSMVQLAKEFHRISIGFPKGGRMLRQQTLADCIDPELILNKSSMPRREKGPRHFLESGFQLAVNDWVVPEWH